MMLGRVPVHPVLVGAFPVLLLWAQNGSDVPPGDGTVVLAAVVAVLVAVTAAAGLVLRDARRGGLVASALGVVALSHGHMWGTSGRLATLVGLPVAALLVGLAVRRVRRLDADSTGRVTATANVLAAALVVATLPGVLGSVRSAHAAQGPAGDGVDVRLADDGTPAAPAGPAGRDVVWIVPDRHGSEAGLAHTFGLDTSGFTDALEDRGFSVADDARSNYPKTNHSLAAALQLDYLDELAAGVPDAAQDSTAPVNALLSSHEVGRRFRAAGYHTVHLGSWWGPTARSSVADEVLTREAGEGAASEFADVFLTTTILHPLDPRDDGSSLRARQRRHGQWQLDQLDEVAHRLVEVTDDAPRFVFVHLLLPHEPYVFDADGSLVDEATEDARTRADNYERQLAYLHQRLLAVLDTLSQAPDEREPIVLLQADEGPHPERAEFGDLEFAWSEATDAELLTKFSILSALRVPGRQVELREDVTAVNAARVLVDEALGTTLGELPDRSYVFPDDEHYYDFTEVTARLDAAERD